jgi:hypothetical protein
MKSILNRLSRLKARDLYRLSDVIELELQRRFEASNPVVGDGDDPLAGEAADSSLLPMPAPGRESVPQPRRAA